MDLLNKFNQLSYDFKKSKVEFSDIKSKQEGGFEIIDNRITTKPVSSGLQVSRTIGRQGQPIEFEKSGTKKGDVLNESAIISRFESPEVRQTMRFSTPADQQKVQSGTYQPQSFSQMQVRTAR